MEKRFPALRIIAVMFKVVAWLVLILGVVFALVIPLIVPDATQPEPPSAQLVRWLMAGSVFVGAFIYWLIFYALAEVILVALAIEENTRHTAAQLTRPT